jgi:hypothetical protein
MSSNNEPPQSTGTGSSLADRISKPDSTALNTSGMDTTAQTFQPATRRSWADEANSPVSAHPNSAPSGIVAAANSSVNSPQQPSQMDGAAEPFNGSQLTEPDYTVEVKLADMQADPNNPLYSVKSFEELGL